MNKFFKVIGIILLIIFLITVAIILTVIKGVMSLSDSAKVTNQNIDFTNDILNITVPLVKGKGVLFLPGVFLCHEEVGYQPKYNYSSWCGGQEYRQYDYSNCSTEITYRNNYKPDIITIYRKQGAKCIKQDINVKENLKSEYEAEFSLTADIIGLQEDSDATSKIGRTENGGIHLSYKGNISLGGGKLNVVKTDLSKYKNHSILRINNDYKITLEYSLFPDQITSLKSDELSVNGKKIILNFE